MLKLKLCYLVLIVGERCRKQNFPTRFTKIHLGVHLATSHQMHLHTFVDRARKRSRNGDEVVVHDVIQPTGDPSTERTAPPRSTHLLLDPARGEERLREMASAAARRRGVDGDAVLRQSFAKQ